MQPDPAEDVSARVRRLEDRSEITELMHRYAEGVRTGSAEAMAACFSDDASIDYGEGGVVSGSREIGAYFARQLESRALPSLDERLASTPVVSNLTIELDGDSARCGSTVLAVHAGLRGGRECVLVRGTRNDDDVVRTSDGWRIRRRVHSTLWQFEVATPAE